MQPGTGVMFVSNRAASQLARFDEASTLDSNVLPKAFVRGSVTRILQPGALTYDAVLRRMYVPNGVDNSILIFDNIREASENVPPTRSLYGMGTQLNRPVHVQLDSARDLLYVANAGTNSVQVYASASTLDGPTAPARVLLGSSTQIGAISFIWLDTTNDRLWVADPVAGALLVYNQASTLNGDIPPTRVISGANTRLLAPQSILLVDKRLYVACTNSILRFDDADAISGNVAPTATLLGGGTYLNRPQQMALRADKDELYVADAGANAVFVFSNASTFNGSPFPVRRIQGNLTGFSDVVGVVLDFSP